MHRLAGRKNYHTTLTLLLIPKEQSLGALRSVVSPDRMPISKAPALPVLTLPRLLLIPSPDHDGIVSHSK